MIKLTFNSKFLAEMFADACLHYLLHSSLFWNSAVMNAVYKQRKSPKFF